MNEPQKRGRPRKTPFEQEMDWLSRWGFRKINSNGIPIEPATPKQKQPDEEIKEVVKKVFQTPNVNL